MAESLPPVVQGIRENNCIEPMRYSPLPIQAHASKASGWLMKHCGFPVGHPLRPDPQAKTLTIRLHRLPAAAQDLALEHVCAELTATETLYPATDFRLVFLPVGSA